METKIHALEEKAKKAVATPRRKSRLGRSRTNGLEDVLQVDQDPWECAKRSSTPSAKIGVVRRLNVLDRCRDRSGLKKLVR
jgi:hypothetical protein